jgi:ferric-dicitrate binding protein FerR (iron transport regulator)
LTGEAFFDVSKDSLHPFVINADELNVRVLGTRFNVSSYPEDGTTDVVLVEGSVGMHEKIENFNKSISTILKPGFKGAFEKTSGKIETQAVVTDVYTSWMKGELVFRYMSFEKILKKMERYYNVTIVNKNVELANVEFNASFHNVPVKRILEYFKINYDMDFSIDNDKIIIK